MAIPGYYSLLQRGSSGPDVALASHSNQFHVGKFCCLIGKEPGIYWSPVIGLFICYVFTEFYEFLIVGF